MAYPLRSSDAAQSLSPCNKKSQQKADAFLKSECSKGPPPLPSNGSLPRPPPQTTACIYTMLAARGPSSIEAASKNTQSKTLAQRVACHRCLAQNPQYRSTFNSIVRRAPSLPSNGGLPRPPPETTTCIYFVPCALGARLVKHHLMRTDSLRLPQRGACQHQQQIHARTRPDIFQTISSRGGKGACWPPTWGCAAQGSAILIKGGCERQRPRILCTTQPVACH